MRGWETELGTEQRGGHLGVKFLERIGVVEPLAELAIEPIGVAALVARLLGERRHEDRARGEQIDRGHGDVVGDAVVEGAIAAHVTVAGSAMMKRWARSGRLSAGGTTLTGLG